MFDLRVALHFSLNISMNFRDAAIFVLFGVDSRSLETSYLFET